MTIYLKQRMLEKDAKFDLLLFDRFFRILADAKHLLALNSDASFVLILTLLKMQEATNLKSIQDIINQVEQLEVQPAVKEAISKQKVVEHAQNDTNHIYEEPKQNDTVQVQEQEEVLKVEKEHIEELKQEPVKQESYSYEQDEETQIQEPTIADLAMSSSNTISLDSIDAVAFETPFDEDIDELISNNTQNSEINSNENKNSLQEENKIDNQDEFFDKVEQTTTAINENLAQKSTQIEEDSSIDALDEAINSRLQQEQDPNEKLYEQVINRVYDRDVRLGECFEDNFVYKSFENSKLEIISYAQGEERKFLFKHFGILKTFIYDVFGHETELDFIKDDSSSQNQKKI